VDTATGDEMTTRSGHKQKETASDRIFTVIGSALGAFIAAKTASWGLALVGVCAWAVIWDFSDRIFGFNGR
jgi:hypothetical protein